MKWQNIFLLWGIVLFVTLLMANGKANDYFWSLTIFGCILVVVAYTTGMGDGEGVGWDKAYKHIEENDARRKKK